jgi:inorganic pyrophosphatase
MPTNTRNPLRLAPFRGGTSKFRVQAVIETPKGSRNKYAYDEESGLFGLRKVLPEGMVFPYDFGFIPSTKAEDGDPLDVLILMDAPAFPGCLVNVRLIGVFEGEQTENGKKQRNDRLIAVANDSYNHSDVKELSQLNRNLLDGMGKFFENYHQGKNDSFKVLARKNSKAAMRLLEKATAGSASD